MFGDENMRSSNVLLCLWETCVQNVKRYFTVYDARKFEGNQIVSDNRVKILMYG